MYGSPSICTDTDLFPDSFITGKAGVSQPLAWSTIGTVSISWFKLYYLKKNDDIKKFALSVQTAYHNGGDNERILLATSSHDMSLQKKFQKTLGLLDYFPP